jgi:predicted phage-related endonuclease
LIKRGEFKKEFSDDQTFRMSVGTALEPLILDAYAKRTGAQLTRGMPLYFHPQWEFMAATPDALGYSEDPDGPDFEEWSVDAKSTNFRILDKNGSDDADKYGEDGTDQVPLSNLFQAQQQMAVMGLSRCDFPVLIDNSELRIYTVDRNEDLIKQIALAEAELVERILNADPPEPNFEHSGIVKVIRGMFGTDAGKVATLSEEDHDLWTRREAIKRLLKEYESECEEIDARLAWSMQDAEVGRFPDASIEVKKITVKESFVEAYLRKPYSYLKARKTG